MPCNHIPLLHNPLLEIYFQSFQLPLFWLASAPLLSPSQDWSTTSELWASHHDHILSLKLWYNPLDKSWRWSWCDRSGRGVRLLEVDPSFFVLSICATSLLVPAQCAAIASPPEMLSYLYYCYQEPMAENILLWFIDSVFTKKSDRIIIKYYGHMSTVSTIASMIHRIYEMFDNVW